MRPSTASTLWTQCKFVCFIICVLAMAGIANAQLPQTRHKDPDSMVDPVKVVESQVMPAPDVTLGDTDTTVAGIANAVVGANDATAYPLDPPSSGHTFWVDNTPFNGDCPQATYVSIQAAVLASGPNDTVKVCPGTYSEQVQIIGHTHDGLRLESLTPLAATIQWPLVPSSNHQLVDVSDANGVTIRGFKISGPFNSGGCSVDRHEGVLFENNATGGRLDHNYVTLIRDSDPALWGCQQGDAVAIGRRLVDPTPPGVAASARVDHNVIDRYQKNGVQAVNPGTYADVRNNTITYYQSETASIPFRAAPNGVVVFREAAAIVEQNAISGNHWTVPLSNGVILDEAPSGSSKVDHNRVFDNDFGIETDTQMGLEISHNSVFNHTSDAITLCGEVTFGCGPAEQIVVRSNDVTNNRGSGITLFGADSNLLKTNHVENNGTDAADTTDGIRVDVNSTSNQVLENHMDNNVTHDCHDDSAGTGTGGTANTWTNDEGSTENRAGLCKSAVVTP
jgi:parallel beta-helix repeat protein